jgi:hypothetical protein
VFDPFFSAIESSALSTFLRESSSLWAFPFVLILHTVGLAFLVGASLAVDLRVLGWARGVPFAPLRRYFVVMQVGFWVNAVSGVLLLIAYPTKALTNPLFYLKLTFIVLAVCVGFRMWRRLQRPDAWVTEPDVHLRRLALASATCWTLAIPAGRFLAYTHTRLMVDLVA